MLELTTKNRSVSIARPGPTSALHEPSARRAAVGEQVAAGVAVGQEHGVSPVGRQRPVGDVGQPGVAQHAAVVQRDVADRCVRGIGHGGDTIARTGRSARRLSLLNAGLLGSRNRPACAPR